MCENNEQTNDEVDDRKQRKQRGKPRDNVVKYREQPEVFLVLVCIRIHRGWPFGYDELPAVNHLPAYSGSMRLENPLGFVTAGGARGHVRLPAREPQCLGASEEKSFLTRVAGRAPT